MPNFANLSIKSKDTAKFTFYALEGEPKLIVRPATESNKPYFNEVLRAAEHLARRKAKVNVDMIKTDRERDYDLFPKLVVIGWEGVKDVNGDVPFSIENCADFLRAIPYDMFDELRGWCRDANNFRDTVDGGAIAGNSQSA